MSEERDQKSLWAINLGLGINILLSVLKTFFGITGHSAALLADGIHSTSDVVYYIVASVFVRMAKKPPDSDHPYGYRQMESIASLTVGAFVITTAVAIFWDSIAKAWEIMEGEIKSQGSLPFALWVSLATVVIKAVLAWYVRRLAKDTNNPIVAALAYDHRNDLFAAGAASIGIFLGQRGLPWIDPLAGAVVAILILRTGIYILWKSSIDLMEAVPNKALAKRILELVKEIPAVLQVEEIQAHRFGPHIVANLTIGIDGTLSVTEGDDIASQVETLLINSIPNLKRVHVHYQPVNSRNLTLDEILESSHPPVTTYESQFHE